MTKVYRFEVTEAQAKTIMNACEIFSRLQGGQWKDAFEWLPLKKEIDYEVMHQVYDEIQKMMPSILEQGIDGVYSSFGVGNPDLDESHDISWDLHCAIRHKLSWEKAVEDGIIETEDSPRKFPEMLTVNYDTPMNFSGQPLLKIKRVN